MDVLSFEKYAERFLKIVPKEGGRIIPFRLNPVQKLILREKADAVAQGRRPRFLILKPRKAGVTTMEQGISFHMTATSGYYNAVTLAHTKVDTTKIFDIAMTYYNNLAPQIKPRRKTENSRELDFPGLRSQFYIGTAGAKAFGRGSNVQRIHGSEVAHWPEDKREAKAGLQSDLISGLLEACPLGEIVFESTAKGMGNFFYRECAKALAGQSEWTIIFIPWFLDPRNVASTNGHKVVLTEEEEKKVATIRKQYGVTLTPEQIMFRRQKQRDHGAKFPQEFPEDPYTCFLSSGLRFFTEDVISQALDGTIEPIEVREDGKIKIFKRPVVGRRYVAGADAGEGLEESDYSTMVLIDFEQSEVVATMQGRWRPEIFAKKICSMGDEYFKAALGIERNNHGHSVINTAYNTLHYGNLYRERKPDGKAGEIGWLTTGRTRPIMLDELEEALRHEDLNVNDPRILQECRTFVDNGAGKYEASPGNYDDLVFAAAIAYQLRKVPGGTLTTHGSRTFEGGTKRAGHL